MTTLNLTGYNLTFDDEFNSRSISQTGANTTWADIRPQWRYDANSDIGFGNSFFVDAASGYDPFSVQNGVLTITAKPDPAYPGLWESGLITTQGHFSQTYGYFEIRANFSTLPGGWDAFWLLPNKVIPDPNNAGHWQELDVVERYGSFAQGVYSGIHTTDAAPNLNWQNDLQVYSQLPQPSGYHTYGMDWEQNTISFYVDGQLVGVKPTPSDMHGPMYLLADLATQNDPNNNANLANVPITSSIDYIRAYSSPAAATTIEAFGSTSLVVVGNNYYLDNNNSGTGPELKHTGAPVVAGQIGNWTPIGAEQTATGYQVAWHNVGADQYSVWTTDSNGNYLSDMSPIPIVSGASATLEAIETSFHQDLNGDGVIGIPVLPTTTIEAFGSTSLVMIGNNYYLDNNSSGTGPELKHTGAPVVAGQIGNWTPIGAEQTATGYQVAWHNVGADQYSVWTTDSNGNYLSDMSPIPIVSGASATLEAIETSFHQDLNGDGVIGIPVLPTTTIEAFGSTSLVQVGSNYYLDNNSSGTGPELKHTGAPVVAGQIGNWTPIGAEQTATGYQVAWHNVGADQYSVWTTDSNGNYLSDMSPIPIVSGASATLEAIETSFHQDLNGDGVIGLAVHTGSTLELVGPTSGGVTFISPTGTLKLDAPSTFTGQIAGFAGDGTLAGSDQVDLVNMSYTSSIQSISTYSISNGVLSVNNGSTIDLLHFTGNYVLANFKFASDGHGGTTVYDPPANNQRPYATDHFNFSNTIAVNLKDNAADHGTVSVAAGTGSDSFIFKSDLGQSEKSQVIKDVDLINNPVPSEIEVMSRTTSDDPFGKAVNTDGANHVYVDHHVSGAQLLAHQSDFHLV